MATIHRIELSLNGEMRTIEVESSATLAHVLREAVGLTGTKIGCGEGICGACSVLVDGYPVSSCIYPALKAAGRRVTTVEGLAQTGKLHPLQQAFVEHGAVQCGYCTPGLLLVAAALLEENPSPTGTEIRRAISGNLCRCTGYAKVIRAIQAVARGGAKADD